MRSNQRSCLRPGSMGLNANEFSRQVSAEITLRDSTTPRRCLRTEFDHPFPLVLSLPLKALLVPLDDLLNAQKLSRSLNSPDRWTRPVWFWGRLLGRTNHSCQIDVKDFDERGVTFQHPQPLHVRRALVVLEDLNFGRIAAEVDLSWCRFSRRGQYTSGGRFVGLVKKTA